MSNVVHLNVPSAVQRQADRRTALLSCFARHRRFGDDVFWLKENAELLNILECTGAELDGNALHPLEPFYAQVENRLGFFPQYYRFLVSICLDLEDLGMPGTKGQFLVDWVVREGLVQAELSDLQRGEARRLALRRGLDPIRADDGLDDRLRGFISRSATFAMPNKKAAYELTHTIFYLSEYGRKSPELGPEVRESLDFAGTLAFLDQNADLLAEVCIAMRQAGFEVPEIWGDWLKHHTRGFAVDVGAGVGTQDDYHEFLVCNWAMAALGGEAFITNVVPDRMAFRRPEIGFGPLREISECMFKLNDRRSDDWMRMRPLLSEPLSETEHHILSQAEKASQCFDAFFEGFARAVPAGMLQ